MGTIKSFSYILNEYISTGFLPEKDRRKYHLIKRYEGKVSIRLKKEATELLKQGRELQSTSLLMEISQRNYLLKFVPKDPNWTNKYITVPFNIK